jgi:hypothetical protein
MSARRGIIFGLLPLLFLFSGFHGAMARKGIAAGKVGVVDTDIKGYGYSSCSGLWTSVSLDSPVEERRAGQYLGYLRTSGKLFAFNPNNDHWYSTPLQGTPLGESVQGATAVCWTTAACYGISSIWTLWRTQTFGAHDFANGGGSAGTFGLVWTKTSGYAYNASSNQWIQQVMPGGPIGGLASDGMGLVWTQSTAYAFDPTLGSWLALDLGNPAAVSADGSGKVGIVWGGNRVQAFSGITDAWYTLDAGSALWGGVAGGEVAILWDRTRAYSFDANTGAWSTMLLQGNADLMSPQPETASTQIDGAFSLGPNPSRDGRLTMQLPGEHAWQVEIVDVHGSRIRSLEAPASVSGSSLEWDGKDVSGRAVSNGVYWVRAESNRRVEARRIVIVQ